MSVRTFEELRKHIGHKIVVVIYGEENVSCECETCNEVLMDYDREENE